MKIVFSNPLFILIAFLLTSTTSYAQPRQDKPEEPIKLSAELVVLDVQVINKKTGQAISGLTKDDLTLYEDGAKQLITHFSQDKLPLSIVLLLDVSGSVLPVISRIQQGGLRALQQLKPEDEIALMAFDVEAAVIQPFTRERRVIADKIQDANGIMSVLNETRKTPPYGTHIADSIYQAARYLLKSANPDGRRAIIVITDNEPYEKRVTYSKQEVTHQLAETGAVVYGLVLPPAYEDDTLLKVGRRLPTTWLLLKLYNKGGNVNIYSDNTGGGVLKGDKDNVEEKLTGLIGLLRSRYSLGYVPSNQKRDDRFRKIKLKISPAVEKREGSVAIVTRKGYYARKGVNANEVAPQKPR